MMGGFELDRRLESDSVPVPVLTSEPVPVSVPANAPSVAPPNVN